MARGNDVKSNKDLQGVLRKEAEKKADNSKPPAISPVPDELNRLVHELQVHQIELEMQNDELRKAQVEVEESRHRYSDLYDFAPVGYATLDGKGVIEEINLTGSRIIGRERSILIGSPFSALVARQDLKAFFGHIRRSLETEELTTTEVALAATGGVMPVQLTSVPVSHEGQIKLRTVISDISERKEAEEELARYRAGLEALVYERTRELENEVEGHRQTERKLKEREENFKNIMESSTDGILMLAHGAIVSTNLKLTQILGFGQEELLRLAFIDLLHADEREKIGGRIKALIDGQLASYRCETVLLSKAGETVSVELNASLTSWQWENAGLIIISDITMRKKMEDELSRAQRLESVGLLAGGIAHDFNNMLTSILGNISMAVYDLDRESKSLVWLSAAEKATLRAKDLTHQLITFARGGTPIKEAFPPGEVLRESVSLALSGSQSKSEFFIADDIFNLDADKGQINQVIHNIVINAAEASPGQGVINVRAENAIIGPDSGLPLKEGRFVKISIEDHGCGIAPENLGRIFDPYFTTKPKGNGLGLASAYSIVKKHGGHISVHSRVGTGTIFDVYLPASDKGGASRTVASKEIVSGSGRILVMDDQEMIRDTVGAILATAGYEVEFAKDGREAIDMYARAVSSSRPFDLVVMDLTIPGGMGGKEAIKALRSLYPGAKAIVSSGYSSDPVMADHGKYGFDGMIIKPYTTYSLTEIVSAVIGKQP